jgi:hypothetical protein
VSCKIAGRSSLRGSNTRVNAMRVRLKIITERGSLSRMCQADGFILADPGAARRCVLQLNNWARVGMRLRYFDSGPPLPVEAPTHHEFCLPIPPTN